LLINTALKNAHHERSGLVPDEGRAAQLRRLIRSRQANADLHAVALQSEALAALTGGVTADRSPPNPAGT
jgi:hypothetical protein